MPTAPIRPSGSGRYLARAALGALVLPLATGAACLQRPIETQEPRLTSTIHEILTQSRIDKIDLLLTIDDSRSMADKQALLARAIPDLVGPLLNPPCLDAENNATSTPASPLDPCPEGAHREFDPVVDIHIGVISTSLGSRGGSVGCADDAAHLLDRDDQGGSVSTYSGKGFLAWDPAAQLDPKGEDSLDHLGAQLADLVSGVGQSGCGYEAQLESWYRFLVDPEPYESIELTKDASGKPRTELRGIDEDLLKQRRDFLRPDSMVAIVVLSDENDCSFRATGQAFFTATPEALSTLKARHECSVDENDPCCAPCGYEPSTCAADPTCGDPLPPDHTQKDLACFDQKRRFGVDFLYPTDRYVQGLTSDKVPNQKGELVDNPLFVSEKGAIRPSGQIFLAGIVGVPWQDVARRREDGTPDLALGLKRAEELAEDGTWDVILGDPAKGVHPTDPHMVESPYPRSGQNPITGDSLAGPESQDPYADPISGHEHTSAGELQYACVFDLPDDLQRDCDVVTDSCDCESPDSDKKPLCQDVATGSYGPVQRRAKASPSLRELSVLRGIADQAIVASICAAEVSDKTAPEYGYRPAIGAIVDRLKTKLLGPCLPRTLSTDDAGQVACVVLEGTKTDGGVCDCSGTARRPVSQQHRPAIDDALSDPSTQAKGLDCFCEIEQLAGQGLAACQSDPSEALTTESGAPVDGYCYVDATTVPKIGNPVFVDHCPATEKRTIRLVGEGEAKNHASIFLTCQKTSD